jgi:hypothetical protein
MCEIKAACTTPTMRRLQNYANPNRSTKMDLSDRKGETAEEVGKLLKCLQRLCEELGAPTVACKLACDLDCVPHRILLLWFL